MQERAVETRRRIIEGAAVVFDKHGFVAATMSEILAEAGLTKGALYFHFATKDDLAHAVFSEERSWAAALQIAETDEPVQDVIDFTHTFARALQTDHVIRASIRMAVEYGTFRRQEEFTTYTTWSAALHAPLQRARGARRLRAEVSVATVADALVASFTGLQIMSQSVSERKDLPNRLSDWWQLFLPGIVPARHIARYLTEGRHSSLETARVAPARRATRTTASLRRPA